MAKVQKNFMIDPELAQLIDKVLELSGMTFTRFATGAILEHMFSNLLERSEIGLHIGPDAYWTRLATRLERGDVKVGQIPDELLRDAVAYAEAFTASRTKGGGYPPEIVAFFKKQLPKREQTLEFWRQYVKDSKGDLPAAVKVIEEDFIKG